ncbi:hypothetical protein BpHYR1_016630 [Brachionus plicatilis]|uniref:Uncharacterized protein n=1 Tax=Brachionus plicatilis TaxID=10195 RepID=A0A3M7QUD4_BRAPC|nr:hypothetical protein BpHYR1_016630 [Brachionus plicatilis]
MTKVSNQDTSSTQIHCCLISITSNDKNNISISSRGIDILSISAKSIDILLISSKGLITLKRLFNDMSLCKYQHFICQYLLFVVTLSFSHPDLGPATDYPEKYQSGFKFVKKWVSGHIHSYSKLN